MNEFKVTNFFKNEEVNFQELINEIFIQYLKKELEETCNNVYCIL